MRVNTTSSNKDKQIFIDFLKFSVFINYTPQAIMQSRMQTMNEFPAFISSLPFPNIWHPKFYILL